ncbi:MAG: hypothetical protein ACYDG4_13155 [Desulfuromonadaceae bacterium]
MGFLSDFFHILIDCIAKLKHDDSFTFFITLIIGILLGGGSWVLCSYYSRLWNLRYRVTMAHHILCGIAAILTVFFTLTFVSLKYTKDIAYSVINTWQRQIRYDSSWQSKIFRTAYEKVKQLGIEDFSRYPHPDKGGTLVPANKAPSRKAVATLYATEAVQHFKHAHPYLGIILKAQPDISIQVISDDVDRFFANNPGKTYSAENAVELAAKHIKSGLDAQVPRVVTFSRTLIVILFFLVQAIPLGLIGWAAYRDVKVIT